MHKKQPIYKTMSFRQIMNAFLLITLVACNGNGTTETPPLFVMDEPANISGSFVNVHIDEVQILSRPGDPIGQGEFRLLIIGADTQGHSSGTYCPSDEPIKIKQGDLIKSPCFFEISFVEKDVREGVFLMVFALDEDKSILSADLTYEIITGQLGEALSKAIMSGAIIKAASDSTVYGFAVQVLVSFLAGKAKEWIEKADFIGAQGLYLSRDDNWTAGRQTTVTSGDGGIRLTYTVSVSTINTPTAPATARPTDSLPTRIPPTDTPQPQPTAMPQPSDPAEFIQRYYQSISNGDYQSAWSMLSQSFKNTYNSSGYGPYRDWWSTVRTVEILSSSVQSSDAYGAYLIVELAYYYTDGRVDTYDQMDFSLIWDEAAYDWKIDDAHLLSGKR